ncbi:VapA/VapB family virulence-associated protein [Arenicella xantha]|uniref:Virulence-associated protein n=1 Tax=Arenicella xantha TaxID=644221 RepID=A0A395JKG1_9GAMM|nr:VapA/VapB family virulence-associated protein [Arenicella xantha]RBP51276.1 virulence-associated protein [Arenicella xantha]
MSNNQTQPVNLASDFKQHFTGKLSDEVVESTAKSLANVTEPVLKASSAYGANGSLASLIFYVKAQCNVNGGKTFDGSAWGVSFPGGGALFGDVYLADASSLNDLYARTTSFTFTATPVYTAMYFFDSNNTLLGHFQAGSVSTVSGTGGGSGSWS